MITITTEGSDAEEAFRSISCICRQEAIAYMR